MVISLIRCNKCWADLLVFQSNAYQTVGMICSERAIAAGGNQHSISFRFVSMKSHSRRSKTGSNWMASKILTWFQITWNAIDIKFFRSQTVILNPVTFLKSQRFFCSCSRRRRTWYYMSRMHVDIDRYHTNASKTQPATVCLFVILLLLLFTSYMLLFNAWHSNRVHCNRSLQFSSSYKSKSINKNKSLFLMFIN